MPTTLRLSSRSVGLLLTALLTFTACAADPPSGTTQPPPTETTPDPEPAGTPVVWRAATASPTPLYEGQGAAVNGKLYMFGGFSENRNDKPIATAAAHVYDPATDQWRTLKDIPDAVTHAAVAVDGTDIYVAGGFIGDHPGPQTDHVWKYDTLTDTWTALPPLPGARGAGGMVNVNGTLHYFGGTERTSDGTYLRDNDEHWVLPVASPTAWQVRAPLPNARNHVGAAVLNGLVYAVGGQHLGNEALGDQSDVDRYDPATDTWTSVAALPLPLGHITASTVVWNGRIVVIGGVTLAADRHDNEGVEVDTVLAYDPAVNTWSSLTSLPGPRQSPVAVTIGGDLIVTTGSTSAGPIASTFIGR